MTLTTVLSPDRASALVARFAATPVLVVGDVMLDRFIVGRVNRISPEAPVPVVQFEFEYVRLGGAANVAHNLAALGAHVRLIGVVGGDAAAERVRQELSRAGISAADLIEDPSRPTVEKVRVVTERNQQVARIDYESDRDIDGTTERAILERISSRAAGAKVMLVSDYVKGAVTNAIVQRLVALKAATDTPLLIDPKIPHLASYAGASLITPNHHEAETATHRRIRSHDEARDAAAAFRALARCDAVLVTRGEHGMWLSSADEEGAIEAAAREVSDVTGAGDTVISTLALAIASGASLMEAAILANQAAGIVVGKFGPATVSRDELIARASVDQRQ